MNVSPSMLDVIEADSRPAPAILVVDDDPSALQAIALLLATSTHHVARCSSGREALEIFAQRPFDVVILDLNLRGENGLEVMERLLAIDLSLPVIIMTAQPHYESAMAAVRQGAYTYMEKFPTPEVLLKCVENAIERRGLTREVQSLRMILQEQALGPEPLLIGRSHAMQALVQSALRVAPTRATVAVYGESGTGKERLARLIHSLSPRAQRPFVALNCGALPDGLIESELFGHLRGAFTGAVSDRQGLIQAADGGTLFLDEISEASASLQVALLRVLQDGQVRPVGAVKNVQVSTRVIVASNRSLQRAVQDGSFREDLFYRVNVLPVVVPPLRERGDDLLMLADHFLRRYSREERRPVVAFHPEVIRLLQAHPWPGNVRELENVVKRAVVLSSGSLITPADLGELGPVQGPTRRPQEDASGRNPVLPLPSFAEARERFERDYLERLIAESGGQLQRASTLSGRSRPDVVRLLHKHRLELKARRA